MGNKTTIPNTPSIHQKKASNEVITRSSFEFLSIIGRGGFSRVWKVYNKKTKKHYAMKEMSKVKIINKKSEQSVKSERNLLSKMNHPFIVNIQYSFQDNESLYLVLDLLTGGDLRYQTCKYRKFTEEQTRFFFACLLLSLEYCHTNKIIHRDIKPENLVLDEKGYVHLTDFGIAKIQYQGNGKETSGTPGYMSPEVMCGQDHTIAVDYFALGVIGYEFMNGARPYLGSGRKDIKEKIMAKQAQIEKNNIPDGWSIQAADCFNRLLIRKPMKRLGYNGPKEVKEHPWFKHFPWKELYLGKIEAPFIPKAGDNYDYKYCNAQEKQGLNTIEKYNQIIANENYSRVFDDYHYFNRNLNMKRKDEDNEEYSEESTKLTNPHIIYEIENDIEIEKRYQIMNNTNNNSKKSFQSLSKVESSLSMIKKKGNENEYAAFEELNDIKDEIKKEASTAQGFYPSKERYINQNNNKYSQILMRQDNIQLYLKNKSSNSNNSNSNGNNNCNSNANNNILLGNQKSLIKLSLQQRNYSSNSTNLNSNK